MRILIPATVFVDLRRERIAWFKDPAGDVLPGLDPMGAGILRLIEQV